MSTDRQTAGVNLDTPYERVERALESNGVEVAELKELAADPYLHYRFDPDAQRQTLVVIALVFAKVPELVYDVVQVAALDENDVRVGYFYVDRELIHSYRQGEIEKLAYVSEIEETWRAFGVDDE